MVYKINLISNDIKRIIRKAINIFLLFNLFSFIVSFHITINTYLEFQIEKISNFYNTQNVLELEKKQDEILREAIGLYGLKTVYKLDNNNYMKDLCFPLDSLKEINYISISKYCLIYDNKTIYLGFFFPSDSQRTFLMVVENSDLIWRFIILGILIMILDFIYFTLFLVYIGYRAKYLEANNIYKYEVKLSNKVNSTLTENIHHELKTPLLVLTESISSIVGIVSQAWNWVAAKFQWAWGFIKIKALQIYETLKNVFGGVFNFFKSIFGNIWNIVSKVFDKIWQKIKGIIDFLKPLADAIGKLFNKAGGEFSKGMKQGVKEVADEKKQKVISKKRYDGIMKKEQSSLDFNPAGSVSADNFLGGEKKGKEKTKVTSAKSSNEGLSMSGEKGGNRTINQTININNYFSAAKQSVGKIADEVAAKINDRLRDGMVALD
jgi:hypothetical protein